MNLVATIRKTPIIPNGRLRAFATVEMDGIFAVHGIRVLQGDQALYIGMPSNKDRRGRFHDVCHPISNAFRQELEAVVLEAYNNDPSEPPVRTEPEPSSAQEETVEVAAGREDPDTQ